MRPTSPTLVLLLALLLTLLLPALTSAAELDARVAAVEADILRLRHDLHTNPELSNQEFETGRKVAAQLRALGMEVHDEVAITGVVGILRGGRPGPVVAVRADMDALPVTEDSGLIFASTRHAEYLGREIGVAHACGHDVHTSVQMGVATVLAGMRDEIAGTVIFVFQPAEEGTLPGEAGGASLMVEEGLFGELRPEAMFALHSWPSMEVGQVGFTSGPSYASSDHFLIDITGQQAHGAWPQLAVDPVVTAAEAIQALQTIRSRNIDPQTPAVITVGIIRGGERFNIIPEAVHLEGTVRAYSSDTQDLVERRMHEILAGVTSAAGASYTLVYDRKVPPTVNDPGLATWARGSLVGSLGADAVLDGSPSMGAEDFSEFLQDGIPGFYFRLGVTDPAFGSGPLHTPTFRADDASVAVGIRAMSGLVLDYLEQHR
jgi:amidohydrolase